MPIVPTNSPENSSRSHQQGDRRIAEKEPIRRILVTGGAGFLGSHLCDRLISDGHEVVCMDNLSTGRLKNIFHLVDNPKFSFITHDVVYPISAEVDAIYNLACPASPPAYQADPIQTTKTSVLGALNLLEMATQRKIKIFQASTSEVYGDPLVSPQSEAYWGNVDPIGPRSCYDVGKRCAESLFFDFFRRYGTRIKVARIFNTYGPRMRPDDGRVISNFIVEALQGNDITIYGDGSQTRSFCYVDDMMEGFRHLMATPDDVRGPINLGNPAEHTIREIAELVIELTGSRSGITHKPLPIDDPHRRRPDLTLAKQVLDCEPQVPLVEGLQKTIAYFESELTDGERTLTEAIA